MASCSSDATTLAPANFTTLEEDAGRAFVPDAGSDPDDAGGVDTAQPDAGPRGPIVWDPDPGPPPDTFRHGVASGDPASDRVVLWTRVSAQGSPPQVDVRWTISTRPDFVTIEASGTVVTGPGRDYTVKVDASGLMAGQTYWYRFEAEGVVSPVGRTKTLPEGPLARARFAVASCARFEAGFFNAYQLIARERTPDADLNAVIHLGDYLYEYGEDASDEAVVGRELDPTHEVLDLDGYRRRHGTYKMDRDLQAMHASHPVIAIWDDHEFANDAWRGGAQNHDEATEGRWSDRKAAAARAYFEWMPIRDPDMGAELYRDFRFGDLVSLHLLDTRLTARDRQIDLPGILSDPITGSLRLLEALLDPSRTLLGNDQEGWLDRSLIRSDTAWRLVGNQVMMGQLYAPAVPDIPVLTDEAQAEVALIRVLAGLAEGALSQLLPGPGLPINMDAWDGYAASRTRLFETLARVDDVVVLTGDYHSGWALDLAQERDLKAGLYDPTTGEGSVAVEFVTPSVTSPGFDGMFPDPSLDLLANLLLEKNRHVRWANLRDRGFLLINLTQDTLEAQYVFTPNVKVSSTAQTLGPKFIVERGQGRVSEVR